MSESEEKENVEEVSTEPIVGDIEETVFPETVEEKKKILSNLLGLHEGFDFSKCPIPPAHVKDYDEVTKKYLSGEASATDVMDTVLKNLKHLKK